MTNTPPPSPQDNLDQVFMALADPTRRQIVRMLSEQDRTVGELAGPFPVSLAAISKHIKVLEAAGIVTRQVDGRVHTLALHPEALQVAEHELPDAEAAERPHVGHQRRLPCHERVVGRRAHGCVQPTRRP